MIKAVLFDMDGTILDTLEDIKQSVNFALSFFGYPLKDDKDIKYAVGSGAFELIEKVVPKHLDQTKINEVFSKYQSHYDKHANDHTRPYPGIMDLLHKLKEKEYKLGVVSNKFEYLVKELNHTIFQGLFDSAIGATEKIPIKPHPDMVYKAMDELNVKKDEVIYLGDTKIDMLTAKHAKMKSVGVLWGFRDEKELRTYGAQYIIKHPMELISMIEEEKL